MLKIDFFYNLFYNFHLIMMLSTKLIVLATIMGVLALGSAHSRVDWFKLQKLSSQIQSAAQVQDLEVLVSSAVEILTLTPTDTQYYSVGYSRGEENVLYFNHANALTGQTLRIPLNPFRKIQKDCIYLPNTIKGMVMLYDGSDSKKDLCDVSSIYRANPTGYKPMFSRNGFVRTVTGIKHSADHQSILEAESYAKEYPRYPYALDPHGFVRTHLKEKTVMFLAGYFHVDENTELTKFVPKLMAELSYEGNKVGVEFLVDDWSKCSQCKGDPKEFIKVNFLA